MPFHRKRAALDATLRTLAVLTALAPTAVASTEAYQESLALLAQGQIEQARNKLRKALTAAQSAKERVEELAMVLNAMGRVELAAGRYTSARKLFGRALTLPVSNADLRAALLHNEGRMRLEVGESRRAEELFREALGLRPDSALLWHSLGQALTRQSKIAEAEAALRKALHDETLAPLVWSDIALTLELRGQPQLAVAMMRNALVGSPSGQIRARMLRNLGVYEWKAGDRESGRQHLHESLREMESAVGPDHPDVANVLDVYSGMLRESGNRAEGRELSRRAQSIRSAFAGQDGVAHVDWRELRQ